MMSNGTRAPMAMRTVSINIYYRSLGPEDLKRSLFVGEFRRPSHRPAVRFQDVLGRIAGQRIVFGQNAVNHFGDICEADLQVQEGLDRHFVGRAQHRRVGAAFLCRRDGQVETRIARRFQWVKG